ncbi:MAG: hypothetical protein L6Q37_11260, partial [Bdellovibrionaceae bacterium]|nr:hypothetical protein [Pseudobdellovibrionaceae bacterium]
SEKEAIGLQIFDHQLQALQKNLELISKKVSNSSHSEDSEYLLAEQVLSSPLRVQFFKLQALARMFEKIYDDVPEITSLKELFKKFEDLIGRVDLQQGIHKSVKPLNIPLLNKYFEDKKIAAMAMLQAELEKTKMLSNPKDFIREIEKKLYSIALWKDINEASSKEEKQKLVHKELKRIAKHLAKEAKKLEEKIEDKEFTQNDIELNFHELRRKLRWLVIEIQSLSGLIQYEMSESRNPRIETLYRKMIIENPNLVDSSFLDINPPEIEHPILIPKVPLAMISELVSQIGYKKDIAEKQIYTLEGLNFLSMDAQDIQQIINKLNEKLKVSKIIDHVALSADYQELIKTSELLTQFAESIESLNDL